MENTIYYFKNNIVDIQRVKKYYVKECKLYFTLAYLCSMELRNYYCPDRELQPPDEEENDGGMHFCEAYELIREGEFVAVANAANWDFGSRWDKLQDLLTVKVRLAYFTEQFESLYEN